jgi:hypothetical protein
VNGRLLPLLAGLAACAIDPPEHREPVVRDSAGVRIVENTAPLWPPGREWTLTAEPVVDIGEGTAEEYQLFRVEGAARLSDGRIVVADGGSQELRFYDSAGRHERSIGGRGSGPGEFQYVNLVGAGPGDTLWTWDEGLRRYSAFAPTGELLRSAVLEPFEERMPSPPIGVFLDGSLLASVTIQPPREPNPEPVHIIADYVRYDRAGSPVDHVVQLPRSEHFLQQIAPQFGGLAYWSLAFGRKTTVRVRGGHIFVGDGTSYEVRILDPTGVAEAIIRRSQAPLQVTAADIQAYGEAQLAPFDPEQGGSGDANARRRVERRVAEMPFPTHMPAYEGFLVDGGGGLWVDGYNRPGDATHRWDVFDAEGRWLGALTMPLRFSPLDIGSDYVLGLWRDADDVEHVRMYELVKP